MVWKRNIAYIDLSSGKITQKTVSKSLRKLYLGGRGINMHHLYHCIPSGIDPLDPKNTLLIGAGLLTGIPALGAGRCDIAAKSPLTGAVGDSNIGGFFAPELRLAGFDHLVITGKADKPVYLWIQDGSIEIRNASHLWGKDTFDTQTQLRNDNNDEEIKSLTIGEAGENLVRYANVRTGMKNSAGRTGMGCVMGSKNLKAIAARGTMDIEFTYPDQLLDYCSEMNEMITKSRWARAQSKWGTLIIYSNTNTTGLIRTRNFQQNLLENGENLEPEVMDEYTIGMSGCYGCSVHCRHRYVLKNGPYAHFGEGPEYTSLGAFGTMVDCNKMETVLISNHLVNKYGIDTLEVGGIIAWAMELYEKGILTEKVTDGLKLDWGNEEAVFELIRKISQRDGFGDILADGFKPAIAKIGEESEYYAMQIKGMSNLHSDERPTPSLALNIATATRGADHLRSRPAIDLYGLPEDLLEEIYGGGPVSSDYTSYVGKSRMVWWQELLYAVTDSIGTCKFQTVFCAVHAPKFEEFSKLIYLTSGLEISKTQLMEVGERIVTTERKFNNREGFSRKDDKLPERFFKEPTPIGLPIVKGKKIDREKFRTMIDEYYEFHGWDNNGIPTEETLRKLGIYSEQSNLI